MFVSLLVSALPLASPNPRCPVTGHLVTNPRLYHHVTVHGRRYYVYDREAANRLRACPTCYLAEDGAPLNALEPGSGRAEVCRR